MWEGYRASVLSRGALSSPCLHVFTNRSAPNPILWVFMEASIDMLDYIIGCWVIGSTSNLSPFPRGGEWVLKVPTLITWLVPLATIPIVRSFTEVTVLILSVIEMGFL